MKVKDLKVKLEFTDENGKHQELTLDQYDSLELAQQNGFVMVMDMMGFVFPEENGQSRLELKLWKGMPRFEDLVQKEKL